MDSASYNNTGGKGDRRGFFTINITGIDMVTPKDEWNNLINGDFSSFVKASYGGQSNNIHLTPKTAIETLEEVAIYYTSMNSNYTKTIGVILQDNSVVTVASYNSFTSSTLVEVETGVKGLRKKVVPITQNYNQPIIGIIINEGSGVYDDYAIHEVEFKLALKAIDRSLILHNGEYKKFNVAKDKVEAVYNNKIAHSPANSDNTMTEGVMFTSDTAKQSDLYMLFDGTNSTFASTNGLTDVYYGIVFNKKTNIDSYVVKNFWGYLDNSNHGKGDNRQIPLNWYIEISENTTDGHNGDWTIVDDRKNIRISSGDRIDTKFTLAKSCDTKAIRLRSYGYTLVSYNSIAFTDLSFFGNELFSPGSPYVPAHWFTVSTTTPDLSQFGKEGSDSLSLIDRKLTKLEPLPMTDKSEILGLGEVGKMFSKTTNFKKHLDIRSIKVGVKQE